MLVAKEKDEDVSLQFLLAILNSKFALKWFYSNGKQRGVGVDIGVGKLNSFPVKKISPEAQKPFINLVNQILGITSAEDYDPKIPPIRQKELEKQIDEMVFDLYGLSEEERGVVGGSV